MERTQRYLYDIGFIRNSAVPMGEFWLHTGPGQGVRVDNKVASSVAHTVGRGLIRPVFPLDLQKPCYFAHSFRISALTHLILDRASSS